MTLPETSTTARAIEILDVAERLVQTRGFNGFSYADIAAELGITKPALHYYYASKAALGDALVARYSARFFENLVAEGSAAARLEGYIRQYRAMLSADRMCLCGMLAAEFHVLPSRMRAAVLDFFDRTTAWLEEVVEQGAAERGLSLDGSAGELASVIIDTIHGAMLIARAQGRPERFDRAASRLLASIARADSRI